MKILYVNDERVLREELNGDSGFDAMSFWLDINCLPVTALSGLAGPLGSSVASSGAAA